MSGTNAAFGHAIERGATRAVDEINRSGGVFGEPLVIETGDDLCDPKLAVRVADRFVRDGIRVVIGHLCRAATAAAAPIYRRHHILEFTPSPEALPDTGEPAFQGSQNLYDLGMREDAQAVVAGRFLAQRFPSAPIALLDDRSAYGRALVATAQATLDAAGHRAAFAEEITPGDFDLRELVGGLSKAHVAAIYFGGYPTDAAVLVHALRHQRSAALLVGADALGSPEFWRIAGADAGGMLFTALPAKQPSEAANAFAAMQIFAEAAKRAGSLEFDALAQTLVGGDFATGEGRISFNSAGERRSPQFVLRRWRDGTSEPVLDTHDPGFERSAGD